MWPHVAGRVTTQRGSEAHPLLMPCTAMAATNEPVMEDREELSNRGGGSDLHCMGIHLLAIRLSNLSRTSSSHSLQVILASQLSRDICPGLESPSRPSDCCQLPILLHINLGSTSLTLRADFTVRNRPVVPQQSFKGESQPQCRLLRCKIEGCSEPLTPP